MSKFFIGMAIIAIAAALGWFGTHMASEGWIEWKKKAFVNQTPTFKVTVHVVNNIKYPGPLWLIYNSQLGKTISPISLALYIEIANNRGNIVRIQDMKSKALIQYDEGGTSSLSPTPLGGTIYRYTPSGKTVEKWRSLYSVGLLNNEVYYVANDMKKSRRIDFSKNGLERIASDKQLQPGESILGWIFYELEEDLRGQIPEIKKFEFEIKNSSGDVEIIQLNPPKATEESTVISAGKWEIQPSLYDLTKDKYTISPIIDLRKHQ